MITNASRLVSSTLVAATAISFTGCIGSSSSDGGGSSTPSATVPAGVTPTVTPAGTSGNNLSVTLPGGIQVTGSAVVGESVPAQSGTVTLPNGTAVEVRHGFFPGDQASLPSGSG